MCRVSFGGKKLQTSSIVATALTVTILCQATLLGAVSKTIAGPSVFPTGVTRYDPDRAYNSYVLFSGADRITRLIDLNGNVVNEWKYLGFPSLFLDPKLAGGDRGHVLLTLESVDATGTSLIPGDASYEVSATIGEVDWNGKIVWKWGAAQAPGGAAQQHHDWRRLPNGNTIILANLLHPVSGFTQPQLLDDVIYELNPSGAILWKWIAAEHLDEFGFTPAELKLVQNANGRRSDPKAPRDRLVRQPHAELEPQNLPHLPHRYPLRRHEAPFLSGKRRHSTHCQRSRRIRRQRGRHHLGMGATIDRNRGRDYLGMRGDIISVSGGDFPRNHHALLSVKMLKQHYGSNRSEKRVRPCLDGNVANGFRDHHNASRRERAGELRCHTPRTGGHRLLSRR